MTLTRQHFQLVADLLRHHAKDKMRYNSYIWLCEEIADDLSKYNIAFDKNRFLKACM